MILAVVGPFTYKLNHREIRVVAESKLGKPRTCTLGKILFRYYTIT